MKPQLGDTISNRYVLVSPLREETGLQVWKASDHVLARDCQLFIVNNRKALQDVNATASMLAISHDAHFTQVLQLQHVGEVALVITQLDAGMSLSEYLTQSGKPLAADVLSEAQVALRGGSIANDASLDRDEEGIWQIQGDPTEAAFLVAALSELNHPMVIPASARA